MRQTHPAHQTAVRTQARMSALQRRAHDVLEELDRQRDYDARLAADERLLRAARRSDRARAGELERIASVHDRVAAAACEGSPTPPHQGSHETPRQVAPAVTFCEVT